MKKAILACLLALSLCALFIGRPATVSSAQAATATNVLILYDAPPNDPYTNLDLAYAIMLRNLLGHWSTNVSLVPVQNYVAGSVQANQVTFYLGNYYNNTVPAAFLKDVMSTTSTVVWFKYNLWELAWDTVNYANPTFTQKFGIAFNGVAGFNGNVYPSSSNPNPGFFDTVTYKGMSMVKYYSFNSSTGVVSADPDIGVTQVADATKASARVNIANSQSGAVAPYVMRSSNFWYIADIPFSFIGPRDRYLAFCDLLHDILGDSPSTVYTHRAMVRFEDMNAYTSTSSMKKLTDYLYSLHIPFSMATIPVYTDPNGYYNSGVPETISLANATGLKSALTYALRRGGKLVMHGYTHQYENVANLDNAVSGNDFEFWYAVANTPTDDDSLQWAGGRLDAGLQQFTSNGYTPFAWEAPHYESSPLSIAAVPPRFTSTYQRVVYFACSNNTYNSVTKTNNLCSNNDLHTLNSTANNHGYAVGQFFPYVIQSDYYGQRVIPENLGNIEYNICNIDPFSCLTYTAQDLYLNAQYAWVVRDGFASFFFHPFWLDSDMAGTAAANAFQDFQGLVSGITKLGYQWVDASTAK